MGAEARPGVRRPARWRPAQWQLARWRAALSRGSLRFRVTLLLLLLGLPLLALLSVGIPTMVKFRFAQVERQQLDERRLSAADALEQEGRRIGNFTLNFASWSETYWYVLGRNPGYEAANLVPSTFQGGDVDLWGIRDLSGRLRSAARFDGQQALPARALVGALFAQEPAPVSASRIVWVDGIARLVATRPITQDSGEAPVVGTLLLARTLGAAELASILRLRSGEAARLIFPAGPSTPARPLSGSQPLSVPQHGVVLESSHAQSSIRVLGPGPGEAILELRSSRDVYRAVVQSLSLLQIIAVVALVVCVFSLLYGLDRGILRILEGYKRDTERITRNPTHRLRSGDSTELGLLATTINELLDHQERHKQELRQRANIDATTGALTLHGLLDGPATPAWAVLVVDLTHGRNLRALYGQATVDSLMGQVAARLQRSCAGHPVAHLNPGEFTVVFRTLPLASPNHLIQELQRPYDVSGSAVKLDLWAGWARGAAPQDLGALLGQAGLAAQYARDHARLLVTYDDTVLASLQRQHDLRLHLQGAESRGELSLAFQPICTLPTQGSPRRLPGSSGWLALEALLRWHSPVLGQVSPAEFIPVAERGAMIYALGDWALCEALSAVKRAQANWPGIRVSVNVSPLQLLDPDYAPRVLALLAETRTPPQRLILEVTESTLMQNTALVCQHLGQLRAAGVWIALDDFGTGHSSLSLLTQVPLDVVKLDRSFLIPLMADTTRPSETVQVRDVDAPPSAAVVLLQATLRMVQALGLKAVVEGVEDAQMLALIESLGCDYAQGYHLTRPQPLDNLMPDLVRPV